MRLERPELFADNPINRFYNDRGGPDKVISGEHSNGTLFSYNTRGYKGSQGRYFVEGLTDFDPQRKNKIFDARVGAIGPDYFGIFEGLDIRNYPAGALVELYDPKPGQQLMVALLPMPGTRQTFGDPQRRYLLTSENLNCIIPVNNDFMLATQKTNGAIQFWSVFPHRKPIIDKPGFNARRYGRVS